MKVTVHHKIKLDNLIKPIPENYVIITSKSTKIGIFKTLLRYPHGREGVSASGRPT